MSVYTAQPATVNTLPGEYAPPTPRSLRLAGADAYAAGLQYSDLPDNRELKRGYLSAMSAAADADTFAYLIGGAR